MYCRECGKPLLESDRFCSNCGTPVIPPEAPQDPMFKTEEPAPAPIPEEPAESEFVVKGLGDEVKWNTDMFPSKQRKTTKAVDFHWNIGEDEFRNRPFMGRDQQSVSQRPEPSLWAGEGAQPAAPRQEIVVEPTAPAPQKGLSDKDTGSWDRIFAKAEEKRHTVERSTSGHQKLSEAITAEEEQAAQREALAATPEEAVDHRATIRMEPIDSEEAFWRDSFHRDEVLQDAQQSRRIAISRDEIERGKEAPGVTTKEGNKLVNTMAFSKDEVEEAIRQETHQPTGDDDFFGDFVPDPARRGIATDNRFGAERPEATEEVYTVPKRQEDQEMPAALRREMEEPTDGKTWIDRLVERRNAEQAEEEAARRATEEAREEALSDLEAATEKAEGRSGKRDTGRFSLFKTFFGRDEEEEEPDDYFAPIKRSVEESMAEEEITREAYYGGGTTPEAEPVSRTAAEPARETAAPSIFDEPSSRIFEEATSRSVEEPTPRRDYVSDLIPQDAPETPARDQEVKELEEELFRDMEEAELSEAEKLRKRQTEKINKFYTFNEKNEEFQKLLDREYEKFRQSQASEDLTADLDKLGNEDFFEDFSNEGASHAIEMAQARQTMFHEDLGTQIKEAQAARDAQEEREAARGGEEAPAAAAPEAGMEAPGEEGDDENNSFLGRLFGRRKNRDAEEDLLDEDVWAPVSEDEEENKESKDASAAIPAVAAVPAAEAESEWILAPSGKDAAEEAPEAAAEEAAPEEESVEEPAEEAAPEEIEEPAEEAEEAAEEAEAETEEAAEEVSEAAAEEAEEAAEETTAETATEEAEAEEEEAETEETAEEAEESVEEEASEEAEEAAEEESEKDAEADSEENAEETDEAEAEAEETETEEAAETEAESEAAPAEAAEEAEEAEAETEDAEAEEAAEEEAAEEESEETEAEEAEAETEEEAEAEEEEAEAESEATEESEAEEEAESDSEESAEEAEEAAETEAESEAAPAEAAEEAAEEAAPEEPPAPTTMEERAKSFEEERAEAWDAFFSDDEDLNAGNTFDAESEEGFLSPRQRKKQERQAKKEAKQKEKAAAKEAPKAEPKESAKAEPKEALKAEAKAAKSEAEEAAPAPKATAAAAAAAVKAEAPEADAVEEEGYAPAPAKGGNLLTSILAVILVLLVVLILIRLFLPDSILSIKMDEFVQKILGELQDGHYSAALKALMHGLF